MLSPAEDTFLSAIINYTNSSTVHFKLSPTYVLYMACRYVLSPAYRPDMSPSERTHKVIAIVNKMVNMMEGVIQVSNAAVVFPSLNIYHQCFLLPLVWPLFSIIPVCSQNTGVVQCSCINWTLTNYICSCKVCLHVFASCSFSHSRVLCSCSFVCYPSVLDQRGSSKYEAITKKTSGFSKTQQTKCKRLSDCGIYFYLMHNNLCLWAVEMQSEV